MGCEVLNINDDDDNDNNNEKNNNKNKEEDVQVNEIYNIQNDNIPLYENKKQISYSKENNLLEQQTDKHDVNQNSDNQNIENENILISKYTGFLIKGLHFENCLIKSEEELINNLRMYIPSKIPKKQKNSFRFNLEDKILSNSINIDFNQNYILALKGFKNIENVKISDGNYMVYHNGLINNEERYIALVVKKIEGDPQILYSPEVDIRSI